MVEKLPLRIHILFSLVVDTVVRGEVDGHDVRAACVGTAGLCVSTERLEIPSDIQNFIIKASVTCNVDYNYTKKLYLHPR